jgi:hypothetical protein
VGRERDMQELKYKEIKQRKDNILLYTISPNILSKMTGRLNMMGYLGKLVSADFSNDGNYLLCT